MTIRLGVIALAGLRNGGTYQYTLSTLQALRHVSGFDITIYGDPTDSEISALGHPIRPFSESHLQRLAYFAAHRLFFKLADPFAAEDVLLAPIYSLALLHTSKPFAFTLHDLQERYYPGNFYWWQRMWRDQSYRSLLGRTANVICESSYVKGDIIRFFGVAEGRTTVITAPPQESFVTEPDENLLKEVRHRLELSQNFLFYPAQFWPHKNHLRLIEAFSEVTKEVDNLELVLTGKNEGSQYESIMALIEKLGLGKRVHILGYVGSGELCALYRLASALVMPSLFESVSIPVYEAFQAGTPVAASGIQAIPEQVGEAGLLFDPLSTNYMRDSILKIIRDPEAARQRANIGRERMRAMTSERYSRELQKLLQMLHRRQLQDASS